MNGCSELQNLSQKYLDFLKNFKYLRKKITSRNIFVLVFYCTKRKCTQTEPQLKVKIKDGREAPKKSSICIFYIIRFCLPRCLTFPRAFWVKKETLPSLAA